MKFDCQICSKSILFTWLTVLPSLLASARGENDVALEDETFMPSDIEFLKIIKEYQADHLQYSSFIPGSSILSSFDFASRAIVPSKAIEVYSATPGLDSFNFASQAIIPFKPIGVEPTPSDVFPVIKQTVITTQPKTTPLVFRKTRGFNPTTKPQCQRFTTRSRRRTTRPVWRHFSTKKPRPTSRQQINIRIDNVWGIFF